MFYDPRQTAYFKEMVERVVGAPLQAAHYALQDDSLQHNRGLLRFQKPLPQLGDNIYGFIEWQLLAFAQSPIARFQVNLLRNQGIDPRATLGAVLQAEASLSWVLWHIYGVHLLPTDDSWWDFRDERELGFALANAGKVLFAYGVPWLELRTDDLPGTNNVM